jgi:RNA polymerase sigma-70 factor (ECF subfamily)
MQCLEYLAAAGPRAGAGGSEGLEARHAVEAREDLMQRLQGAFDQEVLDEATARVRARVEPHTWEAFRLTAVEGLSGAEVSARLGITVATVFKARSKVKQMLQEETARLEGP